MHTDATPAATRLALRAARGCYQEAIILGREALSGATLRGKARSYAARYAASRRNLLGRLPSVGVRVTERRDAHGKRVLVLRCMPGRRQ